MPVEIVIGGLMLALAFVCTMCFPPEWEMENDRIHESAGESRRVQLPTPLIVRRPLNYSGNSKDRRLARRKTERAAKLTAD